MRRINSGSAGRKRPAAPPVLVLLFVFGVAHLGAAQSGRRVRETKPAESSQPAPVITPETIAAAAGPKKRRNLPEVPLVIAGRFGSKIAKPRAEQIYNYFAVRLGEHMKVTSIGLVKRDDAVRRAREGALPYVVFLELEIDAFQNGAVIFNSPDMILKYSVVEVQTGETKAKGKVYYQAMSGQRQRDADDPVKITPEAAGEEAAERVLDWFSLPANLSK